MDSCRSCNEVCASVLKNSLQAARRLSAWCREMGKSEATIKNPGALTGSLSDGCLTIVERGCRCWIFRIHNSCWRQSRFIEVQLFVERDQVGNRMYSAALNIRKVPARQP